MFVLSGSRSRVRLNLVASSEGLVEIRDFPEVKCVFLLDSSVAESCFC